MLFNQPNLRGVAQLVAYLNGVQVVAGSSPVAPTENRHQSLTGGGFWHKLKTCWTNWQDEPIMTTQNDCREKES